MPTITTANRHNPTLQPSAPLRPKVACHDNTRILPASQIGAEGLRELYNHSGVSVAQCRAARLY
ncbi:MAG: hypothetical protein U0Y68_14360 [Blastocatellia bacterium]